MSHDDPARLSKEAARRPELKEIFLRTDVSPAIYADILTSAFGGGWLQWGEPETVWQSIERRFGLPVKSIPQVTKDKMSVMRSLVQQDAIWELMDPFENAVLSFNDELAVVGTIELFEGEQLAWFMRLARRLATVPGRPSEEVIRFVGGALGEYGWVLVPRGCGLFQAGLDAYSLQRMPKDELDKLKEQIAAAVPRVLNDDDTDPVAVGAARHQRVHVYVRERVRREVWHRSMFGVTGN